MTNYRAPATAPEPDWADAACGAADPELFFHPDGEQGEARIRRIHEAQWFCSACPIQVACLRYALATCQEYGVWGGIDERQRRTFRRRRVEQAPASEYPDGRDPAVIASLVAGDDVDAPDRIDVAHAAVTLFGTYKGNTGRVAAKLGVTSDQIRKWVRRSERGEDLVNLDWLAAERRRKARIAAVGVAS